MNKYKNLDGLRGLAALIVVFWHYSLGFLPSLTGNTSTKHMSHESLLSTTPLHLLIAGPSAVSLFFVLSGFVLSLKFFHTKDTSSLASSAIRRYFRLMIPALGSILITYVVLALGFRFAGASGAIAGSDWLGRLWIFEPNLLAALWQGVYTLFFMPFDPNTSYNFNLWTMQYELFGSFIVFMMLALFGKLEKRWIVYVALGIAFAQSYYLGFILGVVIADVWTARKQLMESILTTSLNIPLLAAGLVLLAYYVPPQNNGFYSHLVLPGFGVGAMTILSQTVGGAMVMVAVLSNRSVSKFFELRPLQYLGKVSFSLYLLHLVVLGTVACFIFNQLVWRVGYGPALLAAGGVSLPLTFGAATLYTKYVDASAITFSRLISNYVLATKKKPTTISQDVPSTVPATPTLSSAPSLSAAE